MGLASGTAYAGEGDGPAANTLWAMAVEIGPFCCASLIGYSPHDSPSLGLGWGWSIK